MPVSRRQFLRDSASLATVAAIHPESIKQHLSLPVLWTRIRNPGLAFTRSENSVHITMPNGIALEFLLQNQSCDRHLICLAPRQTTAQPLAANMAGNLDSLCGSCLSL